MTGRQKARRKVPLLVVGEATRVGENDKLGEVVDEPPQAIRHPGAQTREAGEHEPGVHHVARRSMDVRRRLHRHQERHPVDALCLTGKHAAHPSPRLAMLGKREWALQDVAGRAREAFRLFLRPERLAMVFLQGRLEIKRVDRARAAVHEQLDDAADLRRMMEAAERPGWIGDCFTVGSSPLLPSSPLPCQKMRKRHRPEATAGSSEEITARREQERHGRNPGLSLPFSPRTNNHRR